MQPLYIRQSAIVSALGCGVEKNWQHLSAGESFVLPLSKTRHAPHFAKSFQTHPIAAVTAEDAAKIESIRNTRSLKIYDQAALAGVMVAQSCVENYDGSLDDCHVICGSSRGATQSWESSLSDYAAGTLRPHVSPATTPGSFASAVTTAIGSGGGQSFVSSTCTTGLQVVGLAMALLKSKQASEVLAVASEFSTSPFTLSQLDALGVYSKPDSRHYQPFHENRSGMVLGEGAAGIFLSPTSTSDEDTKLVGYGSASEPASATGIGKEGDAVTRAIQRAMQSAGVSASDIDVVVGHGSGTRLGDMSERAGYDRVFGESMPLLTAHKWSWGHVLGASGLMSLVMAAEILKRQEVFYLPYLKLGKHPETLRYVLVTALGFGGHAVAVILKK